MTLVATRIDSSLLGSASFGRPRRMSLSPLRRSASATQRAVSSGASSVLEEIRPDLFRFAFMAMSHADDAACGASRRPHEGDPSVIEPADGHVSRLAVIEAVILPRQMPPREDLARAAHIQPTLGEDARTFSRITGHAHH